MGETTTMPGIITYNGQPIPVLAFYSIQGGVGKSTLARKLAELVTRATDGSGRHPSVLLVDLDVEAQGLSYRLGQGAMTRTGTVHEAIATQNPNVASAQNVTASVSLAAASGTQRGQLYLLPAAPPDETRFLDVIRQIDGPELLQLLSDTINRIVEMNSISCVVIDCAPGAMPYSAAAATIADVPLLIGRNEDATYRQIHVQAKRFQAIYPQFEPARQHVVINAVSVRDYYKENAKKYAIADWIPLTSDVIHETEGLVNIESLRMLLFENYVIDLIKKFLIGHDNLIPHAHDVLPEKWMKMLAKLPKVAEAPRMRRYRLAGRLGVLAGITMVICGVIAFLVRDLEAFSGHESSITTAGFALSIGGVVAAVAGFYSMANRARLERAAHELSQGGPDEVVKRLRKEESHRKLLEEILGLTESIRTANS